MMMKYYNIAHIFIIYTFSLVLLYGLFCYILLITMYRYNYLPGLALLVSGIVIFRFRILYLFVAAVVPG